MTPTSFIHRAGDRRVLPRRESTIPAIAEVTLIDGQPAHRLEGTPEGAWRLSKSRIDAMFDRVRFELGVTKQVIHDATGIDPASVTRSRQGVYGLPDHWVIRLSEFSGIPVAELRQVACMEPSVQPHHRARRTS